MTSSSSPATTPASVVGTDRLWHSVVGGDFSFLLARANAISLALANAALEPYGLKVRSYSVLALAVGDARPSQRELSDFLRLDPSQIVAIVDQLQNEGLVAREPDPNDRRANVVVATDKGRERHRRARIATQRAQADFVDAIEGDELVRFTAVLRHLAGAPASGD